MSKNVRVVVMVAVLCGLHAVAEESCSRDVVVSAVERMSRFEHAPSGLVVSRDANGLSVAHEVGHLCGLTDIYDDHEGTTLGLTQGEIVAAIRGVGGESVDGRVEVKNVISGRQCRVSCSSRWRFRFSETSG